TISDIGVTAGVSPTSGDLTTVFTFTATASGGGGSPYSFSWNFGDGATGSGPSVTHFYTAGGTYSPEVTATDGLGGSHAAPTQTVSVTAPPAPLGATANAPRQAADVGQSVTFTCSATGGTAPYSYGWTFGDGTTGSGVQVAHAFAQAGSYQPTVVVTDSNGGTASGSVSVTISNVQVTASATPASGHTDTLFEFNATANGGGGQPFTYSWDFGDGQSGGGSAVSHSYPNAGNYSPLVRATDSLGASRT